MREATQAVAAVRTARLLDDEAIEARMKVASGTAGREKEVAQAGGLAAMGKFGNKAGLGGAGDPSAGASTGPVDDDDAEKPIDLDTLGTDDKYFGITERTPKAGYKPVGKDKLRKLVGTGYAHTSASALRAERTLEAMAGGTGLGLGGPSATSGAAFENGGMGLDLTALGLGTGAQYAAAKGKEAQRDAITGLRIPTGKPPHGRGRGGSGAVEGGEPAGPSSASSRKTSGTEGSGPNALRIDLPALGNVSSSKVVVALPPLGGKK